MKIFKLSVWAVLFFILQTVFADAASVEKTDYAAKSVVEAYIAKDSANETIGACVITEQNGYGGAVKVLTGVDKDGKITGVEILSHSETPGLGAEIEKAEFSDQFKGKSLIKGNQFRAVSVIKKGQKPLNDEDFVDGISGGTITSKGVSDMLNDCLTPYKSFLEKLKHK